MKKAYELIKRARELVADRSNNITIAKLSAMSEIHDPTLRNLLKTGNKNRTLDNLGKLEKAINAIESGEG